MESRNCTRPCFADEQEKQSFFNDEIIKHQKLIRCVVSRILSNPEDIDDAVQECLLLAWESMDRLKNKGAITAWLCAIARNTAFDVLRKRGRGTVSIFEPVAGTDESDGIVWGDTLISRIPGPEEVAITRVDRAHVKLAYEMLPEQYRLQLYMRYYLEMKVADINRVLGIEEHTRRNACCRAKQAVKRNYERLQAE